MPLRPQRRADRRSHPAHRSRLDRYPSREFGVAIQSRRTHDILSPALRHRRGPIRARLRARPRYPPVSHRDPDRCLALEPRRPRERRPGARERYHPRRDLPARGLPDRGLRLARCARPRVRSGSGLHGLPRSFRTRLHALVSHCRRSARTRRGLDREEPEESVLRLGAFFRSARTLSPRRGAPRQRALSGWKESWQVLLEESRTAAASDRASAGGASIALHLPEGAASRRPSRDGHRPPASLDRVAFPLRVEPSSRRRGRHSTLAELGHPSGERRFRAARGRALLHRRGSSGPLRKTFCRTTKRRSPIPTAISRSWTGYWRRSGSEPGPSSSSFRTTAKGSSATTSSATRATSTRIKCASSG